MADTPTAPLQSLIEELRLQEAVLELGGGKGAVARQHAKGRLTARERIAGLIDKGTTFFELGLWAAWGMYRDWGGAPSAGVVTGIGPFAGRQTMIIPNDTHAKAGAFFPIT